MCDLAKVEYPCMHIKYDLLRACSTRCNRVRGEPIVPCRPEATTFVDIKVKDHDCPDCMAAELEVKEQAKLKADAEKSKK